VLTNDPLAGVVAAATLETGHASTDTRERSTRSRVVMVGEGRAAGAGLAMTTGARPAAAFAVGSLREEATLHLEGLRGGAGALAAGTAEAAQAASVLVGGGGAMIGAEPFQAASDLRADVNERTMVLAANRLIILVIAALVVGGALSLTGVLDVPGLLNGVPQE
jgi:hypothetical protein